MDHNVIDSPDSDPRNSHSAALPPETERDRIALLWQQLAEQGQQLEQIHQDLRELLAQRDPDRLDDLDEAANLLNVSRRTVETLVHAGELPSVKIRRRRLIPHRALQAYIRRKVQGG